MRHYSDPTPINVGTGEELSIADLARLVCEIVGFEGELSFDRDMPDGTPRKLLDVGRLAGLGWRHAIDLRSGIAAAYGWYLANCDRARGYAAE
jgi:GDP-L-fucose synthase